MNPWKFSNRFLCCLLSWGLAFLYCWIPITASSQVQFTFDYSGPDTLYAATDCTAALNWGQPNSLTASCVDTNGGTCEILSLDIHTISGGYSPDDAVAAGETVTITYRAFSSVMGADSLFSFQLHIADSIGPAFLSTASDIEEACGSNDDQIALNAWIIAKGGAVAIDTCTSVSWLDFDYTTSDGQSDNAISFDSLNSFPQVAAHNCSWSATLRFRSVDNWGNEALTNATFQMIDTEGPVLLGIPTNLVANCEAVPPPPLIGVDINASDNCDTLVQISFNESSSQTSNGSCTDYNYSLIRRWTATDDCGNSISSSQNISVLDLTPPSFTAPPDITLNCNQGILPEVGGWPTNGSDNCDDQPDTVYTDVFTAGSCVNNYNITRIWTLRDACNNVSAAQLQQITVRDTSSPTIVRPAASVELACSDDATALAAFRTWIGNRGGAAAFDNCSPTQLLRWYAAVPGSYVLSDSLSIVSPGGLDAAFCPSTTPLVYRSETVDFIVYDECGNASHTTATFSVTDEVPPVFTDCPQDSTLTIANAACEAAITLPLPILTEVCDTTGFLTLEYSIDNGARIPLSSSIGTTVFFAAGVYTVNYYATDCVGNESSCSFIISAVDLLPPVIDCPADTTLALTAADDCTVGLTFRLPLPAQVTDNCTFGMFSQTQPSNAEEAMLRFSYNADYDDYIAEDKQFTFIGTAANAVGTAVNIVLSVAGDIDDAEEYFSLYDDEGNLLGTTEIGQPHITLAPGNCMANPIEIPLITATFSVAVADYNRWSADGAVDFEVRSNTSFSTPPPGNVGDGVSPLCTTFPAGTPDGTPDGLSYINISLDYQQALPSYMVEGATLISRTAMVSPVVAPSLTFLPGMSKVSYIIADLAGNEDTCSFNVFVEDLLPPEVVCQPATIFVHPSGAIPYVLDPAEIDGGSSDNCVLDSLFLSQDTFGCELAGGTYMVELTAVDESGNSSGCEAMVRVEVLAPEPTYSIGLCGNDTLYFFANASSPPPGVVYTYQWSGPQGFVSTDPNPSIPGATAIQSGSYSVSITGLAGCSSIGTVEVFISLVPNTPQLSVNSNDLCANDELLLSTQQYSGNQVFYHWYSGIFPGGSLLTSTQTASLTLSPPLVTNSYYVIVEVDGCSSGGSASELVNVTAAPFATTTQAVIDICEGENIQLGTAVAGMGLTYEWTGPDGFSSTDQNPTQIIDAGLAKAGTYTLVISSNGCLSAPAQTVVNIRPRPQRPMLSTSGLGCEGESIVLTASTMNAAVYTWTSPNFTTQITTVNSLVLNNLSAADAGGWTVYTTINGCDSEPSDAVNIFVEPLPVVLVANNGPGCEGGTVELSANTIPGATYAWTGPNGFNAIGQIVSTAAVAGSYTVSVISSLGCEASASTLVSINAPPRITALSSTAADCVDGSELIQLVATIFPLDDGSYLYAWSGPNGFSSTDSLPTLPLGTSVDNGVYSLIVTNGAGCSSMPVSTLVNLKDIPVTPLISGPALVCDGQALTLTTQTYTGPQVSYQWTTPLGNFTTLIPSLTINPTSPANSGNYSVAVTVNGCTSAFSLPLQVNVNSMLPLPVVQSNSPVCEGETIELSTNFIAGATYLWTGPDTFASNIHNPVIFNATAANAGLYTVQVLINGCSSPVSLPVNVVVHPKPGTPELTNDGPVCIDATGAMLILSVTPGSAIPGASYTWFDAQNGQQVGGSGPSTQLLLNNFTAYGEGSFDFYVIASLNGCTSEPSVPTRVVMNEIPNINAFAGDDLLFCNDNTAILNANTPSAGTGNWMQLSGPILTIADPSLANTMVSGMESGNAYEFRWSLSSGACIDYSTDEVRLEVYSDTAVANAGADIVVCNEHTALLSALPASQSNTGSWGQSAAQAMSGVTIIDSLAPNTTVTGLLEGEYLFSWTLYNEGCGDFSTDQIKVTVEENLEMADGGADFTDCGDGDVFLMAVPSLNGEGSWSATDNSLLIVDPSDPDSRVEGLESGNYEFIWTLDKGICGLSHDTILVNYELGPKAEDDAIEVPFARNTDFDVTNNDRLPVGAVTVVLETMPVHGDLRTSGDGIFFYEPDPLYAGRDSFLYSLCSANCPDDCSTAWVRIVVGEPSDCIAPTIFTPNNDMINDAFVVPCLATDRYPANKVVIFNQWGDEVYRASPYLNDWRGTYNGENLPAGTYFYIIEFGNAERPLSNFLILER